MPDVLAAAIERQSELALEAPATSDENAEVESSEGEPWPSEKATLNSRRLLHVTGSGQHFRDDQYGCPTNATASSEFCWLERSGNWRESRKATLTLMVLAMFNGNLMTWKTTVSHNSDVVTVYPGEFWTFHGAGPLSCFIGCFTRLERTMTGEILDAEPYVDMWHFGGMWSNDYAWLAPFVAPAPH